MKEQELIPHLFRSEFRNISSVLCRKLGIEHLQAAEDITSETFLAALETWTYKGIPANPVAWLYTVAKNKAKNHIRRNQIFTEKIASAAKPLPDEPAEIDLSGKNISDSQLNMLFAICHPSLSSEAQVALALRILCGFGIDEIANAMLTNPETIHKRLGRSKEKLRSEKVAIEVPSLTEMSERMDTVLTTLYLLFSEGYYSESQDAVLRKDFCLEAMRLNALLLDNPSTCLPKTNALMALMCFHASRFEARKNDSGEMVLYNDQDESLWNQELIQKGVYFLNEAARGNAISKYHLEANIAYWHTIKSDTKEKWENILDLYNQLLVMEYSPIAALNRTYAVSKVRGNPEAIAQAEKLNLINNHFYFVLLGELYKGIDGQKARMHFEKAIQLAKTKAEVNIIQKKIDELSS